MVFNPLGTATGLIPRHREARSRPDQTWRPLVKYEMFSSEYQVAALSDPIMCRLVMLDKFCWFDVRVFVY